MQSTGMFELLLSLETAEPCQLAMFEGLKNSEALLINFGQYAQTRKDPDHPLFGRLTVTESLPFMQQAITNLSLLQGLVCFAQSKKWDIDDEAVAARLKAVSILTRWFTYKTALRSVTIPYLQSQLKTKPEWMPRRLWDFTGESLVSMSDVLTELEYEGYSPLFANLVGNVFPDFRKPVMIQSQPVKVKRFLRSPVIIPGRSQSEPNPLFELIIRRATRGWIDYDNPCDLKHFELWQNKH